MFRYIVALYQQPDNFAAPEGFTGPLEISKMDWLKYVEDSNLGPLVAVRPQHHFPALPFLTDSSLFFAHQANYINVEEGTSTVSAIATSAVVSSTLAPASSTSAGTGTTTRATGTSTSAGSQASNGALKLALSPVVALAVAGLTFATL